MNEGSSWSIKGEDVPTVQREPRRLGRVAEASCDAERGWGGKGKCFGFADFLAASTDGYGYTVCCCASPPCSGDDKLPVSSSQGGSPMQERVLGASVLQCPLVWPSTGAAFSTPNKWGCLGPAISGLIGAGPRVVVTGRSSLGG
jgi:hypothetical protein